MKNLFSFLLFLLLSSTVLAQEETFDQVTFTAPKNWKKEVTSNAIQFTIEEEAKGTFCMITLLKAVPATSNSRENFDMAWTSVVKGMVNVNQAPQMQEPATENGWTAQSGYAPFEKDGMNGGVILVTSTSNETMVNIVILTNAEIYEKDITDFLTSSSLKKQIDTRQPINTLNNENLNKEVTSVSNGFTFSTTNFDDGWSSTPKEDWVKVTKGNIEVLLHFPNRAADKHNFILLDGLKNAWDVLVAPRYNSATNMQFRSSGSFESIEFGEADMIQNSTGKRVHVVLFKKSFNNGSGRYIEFITPDKSTFEQAFETFENASANYGSGPGFGKMANMVNYNKFAVSKSDLIGKWTSDFSGMTQYVNAFTGADAGANTHSSNESFEFSSDNTYKWDLGVASGFVGNIKFQSAKSNGTFTVPNNWQVNFSNIEGKPKTCNVQFVCVKGARILWIGETGFGKEE